MRRLLLALTFVSVSLPAFAQEKDCGNDIKTLCKDSTGADVLTCIEQQEKNFSDVCKKKIGAVRSSWPALVSACKPELTKLCGDKKVGDGSLGKCVRESEGKLGTECKTSYAQMKLDAAALPGGAKLPAGIPGMGGKKKK